MNKELYQASFWMCLACLLSLAACSDGSDAVNESAADASTMISDGGVVEDMSVADDMAVADAEVDRSGELYEMDHLLLVEIEIDEEDWTALRSQTRDIQAVLSQPNCMDQPFPNVYTWFSANITVDGQRFENVGLRKKGFVGSLSFSKPSLKVKFDKYVEDQRLMGVERLALNNSKQDPTYVRTCMSYEMFAAAGIPSPRCNFAYVRVNGEELGVFVSIDHIKKRFLRRHFDDESGDLYEGTLSDFREGWMGTFEQKTNEENPNQDAIEALTAALSVEDADLIASLEQVIDLEQFLTFWATETVVAHWDGYAGNTNNFFLYEDPTSGLLHFIPWGVDGTWQQPVQLFEGRPAPRSINAAGALARRLYLHPEGQERYLERLLAILDAHFDSDLLSDRVVEMTSVFEGLLTREERRSMNEPLAELFDFIEEQADAIRTEVMDGPERWQTPMRGEICSSEVGSSSGGFQTSWNSLREGDAFATGSGLVQLTLEGNAISIERVGAAVGVERDPALATLIVVMDTGSPRIRVMRFELPLEGLASDQVYEVGDPGFRCAFIIFDPRNGQVVANAGCGAGQLELSEVSTEPGGAFVGRYDFTLFGRW